jgi:hypothetical protein
MDNEFQCAQCGALYEVTIEKVEHPVRDTPICIVCSKVMSDSVGNLVRKYALKQAPSRRSSDPYTG